MTIALSCNSQNTSVIQLVAQYHKARVELDRINPYEKPDLCIEKSKQIIDLYNKIAEKDSSQVQPQALFVPYSMAAYSYYGKKDIKSAIPYLKGAWLIAQTHSSHLLQVGYTRDALLGIGTILRDAYTDTGEYEDAINLSKEIVSSYERYNPKHLALQQMAESQIYKAKDDVKSVIESDIKALDFYEKFGNDVPDFYVTTIANEILEGYLYCYDYSAALSFIDKNRDRLNKLFQGKDDSEFEQLNQINKYLYQVYQHIGLHQRAVNAAFLVSNFIIMSKGKDSPEYASWMNNAATSYMDLYADEDNVGYLAKADSLFHIAETVWATIPNKEELSDYAIYLSNYGDLLSHRNDYSKAEELQTRALSLHQAMEAPESVILGDLSRLAHTYGDAGKAKESLLLYEELLSKYEKMNDTLQVARTCNLISQIYWIDLNNNELAEKYANQAVELITSTNNVNTLAADILENIGRVYYRLGLERRGLDIYSKAFEMKLSLGVNTSPYEMLNLYEFYIDSFSDVLYFYPQGREDVLTRVEGYCQSLMEDNQGTTYEEKQLVWKAKTVLAKAYMFFRKFEKAEKEYYDLLRVEEELWGKNSRNYIVTLNNLAYNFSLKGDYKKCREVSLKCIELDPSHHNYANVLSSSIALDDIEMVEKYLPLTFNSSLDYLKTQFLFLSNEQREEMIERGMSVGFSNLSLPAYAYPNNRVCAEYAYNSALVSKGLLLSTQNDIEDVISSSNDTDLEIKNQELKQMQKRLLMASDSVDITSLRRNIELKEKEILSSLQSINDYTKNLDITWKDIQGKLNRDDVAIEFVELAKSILSPEDTAMYYAAVAIKKDWSVPKFILLSERAKVDKAIKDLVSKVSDAGYSEEAWIDENEQLYNLIWKPIVSFVEPRSNIYFSPIGLLSITPMEILQDSNGKYLNELGNVYRMTSTKYLCLPHSIPHKANAVLYGGLIYDVENEMRNDTTNKKKREGWQYLPSSIEEVTNISTILLSNNVTTQIYDKLSGTEESFKNLSGKPISILHLATHGFYFSEDESDLSDFFHDMNVKVERGSGISTLLRSGLMFAGGQHAWLHGRDDIPKDKEDGILLSSEISLLDLSNIDHVTLSACQTGLGDISDDGVMGLQRGFKRAGVNSILMTLWPVDDDATQIMMEQFYRNLMAGQSKCESLISAQKYLRKYNDGYYSEPKYWAAFVLLDGFEQEEGQ